MSQAAASLSFRVMAAASLRSALGDLAALFAEAGRGEAELEFGPSGLLRERIEQGEKTDLYLSANLWYPASLAPRYVSDPPRLFARTKLVVLTREGLRPSPARLVSMMMDPDLKLGVSTPGNDPSGDYALELFEKVNRSMLGAGAALRAKAKRLTGGREGPPDFEGGSLHGWLLETGAADLFIVYRPVAMAAIAERPGLGMIEPPRELSVSVSFGMALMRLASAEARDFASELVAGAGQDLLRRWGFETPS